MSENEHYLVEREREREIIVSFDASINLRVSFSRREGRRIGSTRVSRCTRQLWYTRENRRDERGRGVGVLDVSTRLATLVLWGSRREREREKLVRVYVFARQRRERRWGWWREGRVRRREIGQRERRERRCLEFSTKPTSLPTRRVFVVLDGRLRTRIASNASRFEIERERERGGRMTGEKRRRGKKREKREKKRKKYPRGATCATLSPWKGVRKRDITRTLFHLFAPVLLFHPPTRFPRFCQPPPSIRLHLAAFGETEPTPRITELSSRASRPRDATHFPLRSCVTLSWRRELVDNLCDPSRANKRISFEIFLFFSLSLSLLPFFHGEMFSLAKGILSDIVFVSRSIVYDTGDKWNGTGIENV